MKRRQSKLIIGSAIGLAALAVAIDHTRHSLPTALTQQVDNTDSNADDETPCSLDSPCSLDDDSAPCSLDDDDSPCSLDDDDTPCGLD